MKRYYFDLRDTNGLVVDDEGSLLRDVRRYRRKRRAHWETWPATRFALVARTQLNKCQSRFGTTAES
jgi:hypothetical protein